MKLSVIIPVYNEAETVDQVIARVRGVDLGDVEREIIIVDDYSTDGTRERLAHYVGADDITVHFSDCNGGKGTATRIALGYVSGDAVIIQDSDLEYSPEDYPHLIRPILEGREAVVYGSRFLSSMKRWGLRWPKGMRFLNWLSNKILAWTTNLLFGAGITDEATCYKVFRADVIRACDLQADRFEMCPELTAKVLRMGHRIHEVPIGYAARTFEQGKKIKWQDGFVAWWTLVKYRFSRWRPRDE
jgi:glycosyltransferase involved in cell wall biosynthesis